MIDKIRQEAHIPVLLNEVVQILDPKPKETILDLTAGYGGHSLALRARTSGWPITLVDRDQMAISHLKLKFNDQRVEILHSDFLKASEVLAGQNRRYDIILADLGLSSPHLNIASRGFSFNKDGPLDMRMDSSQELTAHEVVNQYSKEEIKHILKIYGEEHKAGRIAREIVKNRPISSTQQLAKIVSKVFPGYKKTHPATKTFQAIRIAVNDELQQLEKALPLWVEMLKPGGRLAVISFHSLEDRIVKNIFSELAGKRYDSILEILTKSPVTADKNELVYNPRARSAKLRVAVKK